MTTGFEAHFKLNEETVEKLMKVDPDVASSESVSLYAKDILVKFANGEIVFKKKLLTSDDLQLPVNNLKDKLIQKRIEDIDLNIKLKKLDLQTKLVHVWKADPSIAVEVAQGRMTLEEAKIIPPDPEIKVGQMANTIEKEPLSFYDEAENRFICLACHPRVIFGYRLGIADEIFDAIKKYETHNWDVHKRNFNDNEKSILHEITENLVKRSVSS